ncbi:unnamed protein product [Calypogeia fissa]
MCSLSAWKLTLKSSSLADYGVEDRGGASSSTTASEGKAICYDVLDDVLFEHLNEWERFEVNNLRVPSFLL